MVRQHLLNIKTLISDFFWLMSFQSGMCLWNNSSSPSRSGTKLVFSGFFIIFLERLGMFHEVCSCRSTQVSTVTLAVTDQS